MYGVVMNVQRERRRSHAQDRRSNEHQTSGNVRLRSPECWEDDAAGDKPASDFQSTLSSRLGLHHGLVSAPLPWIRRRKPLLAEAAAADTERRRSRPSWRRRCWSSPDRSCWARCWPVGCGCRTIRFKIGLVLFTLFASMAIDIVGWPPKRGIDLSGGVVLIYEVDKGSPVGCHAARPSPRSTTQLHALGGEKLEARPISSEQLEIDVARRRRSDRGRSAPSANCAQRPT